MEYISQVKVLTPKHEYYQLFIEMNKNVDRK